MKKESNENENTSVNLSQIEMPGAVGNVFSSHVVSERSFTAVDVQEWNWFSQKYLVVTLYRCKSENHIHQCKLVPISTNSVPDFLFKTS